jgi:two-component system, OmpR family, response regulator MprA
MAKILIVDDDPKLLAMLQRTLTYEGFFVVTSSDGEAGLQEIAVQHPDLVVLDWLMPKLDGIEIVKQLRQHNDATLILMLTARDAIKDRVEALKNGADDYLVKPFAPTELLARVRALLRRPGIAKEEKIKYADLSLDPVTRETRRGNRSFELTVKEFDLLQYLIRFPRQVLRREQILQQVWGYNLGDDNVLEIYIGNLRKKTEAAGESRLIQTVRAVGYVLRED